MPLRDRLWWLMLLGAIASGVGAIILPYELVLQYLAEDPQFRSSPMDAYVPIGLIALLFVILTTMLATMAFIGVRRTQRRKRALRGDLSVMPVADLDVDPARAPDVSREPLAAYWRATKMERYIQAPLFLLVIGVQGVGYLIVLGLMAYGTLTALVSPDTSAASSSRLWIALVLVGILLLGALLVGVLVFAGRYLPTAFGRRSYGIAARADGIECRTELGRTVFIPWGEMRLLEVEGPRYALPELEDRDYRVYGASSVAVWRDNPRRYTQFAPDDISSGEMAVRLRALLDLINARTGLVPRTLSRGLQAKIGGFHDVPLTVRAAASLSGGFASSRKGRQLQRAVGFLFLLALGMLGLAAAVVIVPLTTIPVFNLASALSLVGMALLPLIIGIRVPLVDRVSRRDLRAVRDTLELPSGYTPNAVYALRYDMLAPWSRFALAVLGLMLLVNLPGLFAMLLVGFAFDWAKPLFALFPNAVSVFLAFLVGFCGAFGIVCIAFAWQVGGIVLRADASGISMRIGHRITELPWQRVERVVARPRAGASAAYAVIGDAGRTSVVWPIQLRYPRTLPPSDKAISVGSAHLAAVAQTRSGQQLKVEA